MNRLASTLAVTGATALAALTLTGCGADATPTFTKDAADETPVVVTLSATDIDDVPLADGTVRVLRRRVDATGLAEAEITKQGESNISVQLPGLTPERLNWSTR